ncbi:hypothetical protein HHK36_026979 [Tetracentron sinense]|uniref:Receptor-like PK ALE2 N-terminal domain-containing protein n=1 Tax=Tetracentron sinense TaxID=13715 RepID=A0A834YKG0_TETSI|nr:hypothetical protein HHK36_026979 [Tetracentron sinense]
MNTCFSAAIVGAVRFFRVDMEGDEEFCRQQELSLNPLDSSRYSVVAFELVGCCNGRENEILIKQHPHFVVLLSKLELNLTSVTAYKLVSNCAAKPASVYAKNVTVSSKVNVYESIICSICTTPNAGHKSSFGTITCTCSFSYISRHCYDYDIRNSTGCDQIACVEPLTSTPIGSPCGCVFPMQVELLLGVALYAVFPQVSELEIEVAAGTYLKQSQVMITGASANSQNQGRTVVDINLVPLGQKFDNTTAVLIYERFWQKKVPINMTLFGDYELIYVHYPGLPSSPSNGSSLGSGPSGSIGRHENPITAIFLNKNQKMNARTITIIALSAFVLIVVCFGAVFILFKCRKVVRPSCAVGPAFTSSVTKRSGKCWNSVSMLCAMRLEKRYGKLPFGLPDG